MPENILEHEGASDGTRPPGPAERHGAVAPGLASEASVGPEGRGAADENAGADNYRSVSRQNADRTSKTPAAAEILPSVLRPLSGTAEAFAANNVRMRNKNHIKGKATKMSRRRISCKDLGAGDLEGWVWKKKQIKSFFKPSWNRFWFVLQRSSVYWYTHRNDLKADGYINLQGFKVDRALESRRKFAFKATHPSIKPLYFATDSAEDMYRWIEKLRVVAIASASTEKEDQAADVSESEDDSEEGSAYGSLRSSSSVLRAPSLPVLNMPTGPLKYRHPSCERLCPLASPAPSLSCQQLQWDSPPAAPAGNVTATATAGTAVSLRSPAADRRSLAVSPTPSFLRRSWQALFGGHCELELAGVGAGAAENDRGGGDAGGRLGDDERKRKQQQQQQQQQQGHVRSTSDAEPTPKAGAGRTDDDECGERPSGARRNSWQGHGPGAAAGAGVARGRPEIDAAAGGGGRRVGSLPDLASRLPASRDGGRRPCAAAAAASPVGHEVAGDDSWDELYHSLSRARLFPHGAERKERSASQLRQSFTRRCRNPDINQRLLKLQALHRTLQAREAELRTIETLLSAGAEMSADGFREWKEQHGEHILSPEPAETADWLRVIEGQTQPASSGPSRTITETEI
uniref:Connector enhancer of kinase suppressor of ras 2-like n=1 Tax=Petromyzon marinus TaxID=7757 RepID=A0AAJ7XFW6_PETMA|nr:connector enhancer of kinase suppressor of ras 2-like [Petromyzon marinus]